MGGKAGANRQAIAMNDTYITDEAAEGTLAGAQSTSRHRRKRFNQLVATLPNLM